MYWSWNFMAPEMAPLKSTENAQFDVEYEWKLMFLNPTLTPKIDPTSFIF